MSTQKDLKSKMAVPPIPQAPTRERSHRNRNRMRLEMTPETGLWLTELIEAELGKLTIQDKQFPLVYRLYENLGVQAGKLPKKP